MKQPSLRSNGLNGAKCRDLQNDNLIQGAEEPKLVQVHLPIPELLLSAFVLCFVSNPASVVKLSLPGKGYGVGVCYKHPSTCSKPAGTGVHGTHLLRCRDPYLSIWFLLNCPRSMQYSLWMVIDHQCWLQFSFLKEAPLGGGVCSMWLVGTVGPCYFQIPSNLCSMTVSFRSFLLEKVYIMNTSQMATDWVEDQRLTQT